MHSHIMASYLPRVPVGKGALFHPVFVARLCRTVSWKRPHCLKNQINATAIIKF